MADLLQAWGRALVRHRLAGLLASLLLTALALGAIAARLQQGLPVDFTPQALFMDGGEEIERLEQLDTLWGRDDNDAVILVEGELAREEAVAWLRALHTSLEELPSVVGVQSLANARLVLREGEAMRVLSPLEELPPDEALRLAAQDPTLRRLLISPDGSLTALRVRLDPALEQVSALGPAVRELNEALRALPPPEGLRVQATGVPLIRVEVIDLMLADEARFLPVVAVLFTLTSVLLFRRFWSALGPLVVTVVGTVWALGALLAAGATLNVLSVLVPTLAVVIGVSDGIHILTRYREELDPPSGPAPSPEEAMGLTMRQLGAACALTTFTTAAGFLSLQVAQTRVVRDFGLHAGVAVGAVWLSVMLVLPVWLAWIPPRGIGPRLQGGPGASIFAALSTLTRRHSRALVLGFAALTLVAAGLAATVQTQSHLLEMYAEAHPTAQAVRTADQRLGGVVPVMVHLQLKPGEADLLDPAILGAMLTLQEELDRRPEVGWSSSPASFIAQVHQAITGQAGLPDSREAIAQELLLAEMSGAESLGALLSEDRMQGRILVLTTDAGGRELLTVQRETQARAAELLGPWAQRIDVTGDGFVASSGVERLVNDLVSSVGLVLVVILLTMWGLLRSPRLALIACAPNLLPMVLTAATLALAGEDLKITNIVSFTVALGLAVDDTIHFMARYREERALGLDVDRAIDRAMHGAGRAIVLTSVLLVAGFGVLSISELASTRWFGLLTSVTLLGALLADLLLLPALLKVFDREDRPSLSR